MKSNRKQKQKGRGFLRRDGLERFSKEPCVPDWWGEFWQQAEGAKEEGRIKGWSQLAGGPWKNGEGPRHQTDRCGPDWCPAEAGRKKWHEKENRQGEVKNNNKLLQFWAIYEKAYRRWVEIRKLSKIFERYFICSSLFSKETRVTNDFHRAASVSMHYIKYSKRKKVS